MNHDVDYEEASAITITALVHRNNRIGSTKLMGFAYRMSYAWLQHEGKGGGMRFLSRRLIISTFLG